MPKTVQEIANLISGKIIGSADLSIQGITSIESPSPGLITFAQDEKGLARLESTDISCVIVPHRIAASSKVLIQVAEPKLAWAKLLGHFFPAPSYSKEISSQAFISKSAKLGARVTVESFAVISDYAVIEDDAVIRAHAFIGEKVKIGTQSVIHPSAVIYNGTEIGKRVTIHAGSVIGADGFGYVHTMERQEKIPQVGNVIIEDDVEIGACSTVDRATIGSTRICQGAKIDNQVQIGHNVTIGAHTVISAQSGVSGSSKVGSHVTMGGKAGLGDHVTIGDWTMVGAGSGVPSGKKIPAKQIVFGEPARPYQEARKQIAAQLRSAETLEELRRLKEKVQELEKALSRLADQA